MVKWVTQRDLDQWLDAGAWFIRKMNYILDRSNFEEQIVKTIPKANTSEHKYNQAKCLKTRDYITNNIKIEVWGYRSYRVDTNWSQPKKLI